MIDFEKRKRFSYRLLHISGRADCFVKLKVKNDLSIGSVFYSKDDIIEVTRHESFGLRRMYPKYFEVVTS